MGTAGPVPCIKDKLPAAFAHPTNYELQQPDRENQGFRAGQDTSLPEAKSLRRDDGSGQAVMRVVDASNDAITLP